MTEREMLVAQMIAVGGIVDKADLQEIAPGFRGVVATKDI